MDYTNNNGNLPTTNGTNNKQPHKSRSNAFSQAAVTKQDVGDFQSGYFVMVDTPSTAHQQQRPKTHKTPERHSKKGEQTNQQRPRTANKDIDQPHQQREGDMNVSSGRITTSPHRSPTRNKRSPSSQTIPHHQVHSSEPIVPTSPHKPRKAHSMDSGSPPKDKPSPSPATNRWAGPAFSNAPPPSSLPLPEFPPFAPSSASASPSSSPPQSSPAMFVPPSTYHENIYIQPPLYAVQQQQAHYQPQFSYQFFYSDVPPQASYAEQLSTDLRKMLHIGQPISA